MSQSCSWSGKLLHLMKDEVKQTLKKHDTLWSLTIWALSNVLHSPDEHIIKTNSNTLAIWNNSVSQSVGKSLLCSDRWSSQNQVEGSWQTNETGESHCASVNQWDSWKKDAQCKTCFCATRSTKGVFCLALQRIQNNYSIICLFDRVKELAINWFLAVVPEKTRLQLFHATSQTTVFTILFHSKIPPKKCIGCLMMKIMSYSLSYTLKVVCITDRLKLSTLSCSTIVLLHLDSCTSEKYIQNIGVAVFRQKSGSLNC